MNLRLLAFFCLPITVSAQNLYDPAVVQEIKLTFYQSNWDYKLDSLKAIDNGDYLLAKSVEINGILFDSVGVKYKGNSSYSANNNKNPLHIELNFVKKGQSYNGIKDIKLGNGFSDPTFVREPLSYEIARKYMDAPLSNHAKVWINGTYWGVYSNTESINKAFLQKHFATNGDNAFFKCNPEDFGGPGTGGNYPDLVYSSADSAFYYNKYDIQSDYGWAELLDLMETLKNNPNSVESVLDVDRALWMLAFNNVLVNLDSYTGAFGQNYYLYYDENDRFLSTLWDLNMSFGGFPLLSANQFLTQTQMKQLDPLVQSSNSSRPLIKQLLANPTWKRMYLAHLKTILTENFASEDDYKDRALEMQALIDAAVQSDTKKFYSYANFQANVTSSVNTGGGGGFGTVPGIADLMNARYNFLISNTNLTAQAPSISNVSGSGISTYWVTAQVTNAVTVTLAWREDSSDVFQKVTMLDDGLHQDGAAGDGVFGASFVMLDPTMQYYIYAENAQAGIFSPARAEHEFYMATPNLPNAGDIVINEILADNESGEADEAGELEDWVELYNNTNQPVSIFGLYLSDDPAERNKWAFPANVSIPAHGYLIVWMDNDDLQGPFHANFKLAAGGETLILSNGTSTVLDEVTFSQQLPDVTYGRYPNGTGNFTFMPPTFNAENSLTIDTHEPQNQAILRILPNPNTGQFRLESSEPLSQVRVLNAWGQQVFSQFPDQASSVTLQLESLPAGVYWIKTDLGQTRFVKM
ncbi:MAG TPA: CotH kinase family protein [Saprospiraceae bacterium]|nr:CotH kinase family protein [Saprospiraceae bacterium]